MLCLPSNAKAKHRSTWSWRQVNQPWLRATLHPVRMCLNVAGEHKGQEGSSPLLGLGSAVMGEHHMLT